MDERPFPAPRADHGGMDYSGALLMAKLGRRIARAGWNGKGMWVALATGVTATVPTEDGRTACVPVDDMLVIHNAQGGTTAWLCSQADALACDWAYLP